MLEVTVTFHGPFHIGTGSPGAGLDATVDRQVPLPATSLKGVMRAAALHELHLAPSLVGEVFGDDADTHQHQRRPSPWVWADADVVAAVIDRHARVHLDERGKAQRGFLVIGEQVWATRATFAIELRERLDPDVERRHQLVLRASARAVTAIGAGRHRGQGWVSLEDAQAWTSDDTTELQALQQESSR